VSPIGNDCDQSTGPEIQQGSPPHVDQMGLGIMAKLPPSTTQSTWSWAISSIHADAAAILSTRGTAITPRVTANTTRNCKDTRFMQSLRGSCQKGNTSPCEQSGHPERRSNSAINSQKVRKLLSAMARSFVIALQPCGTSIPSWESGSLKTF
jgi:hypothetical protein